MPQETIYQPQLAPRDTAPLPQAGADAFGAGVGQGIEQVGGAVGRYREAQRRVDEQTENAGVSVGIEQAQADHAKWKRDNPGVVAADAVAADLQERLGRVGDGIASPAVQRTFRVQSAAMLSNATEQAAGREAAINGRQVAAGFADAQRIAGETVQSPDATDHDFHEAQQRHEERLAALDTTPEIRAALAEDKGVLAVPYLQGQIIRDPVAAQSKIRHGYFDPYLTPEQKNALDKQAQYGIDKRQNQIAQAQAHALAERRQANLTTKAQLEEYDGTPDQWRALGDSQRATGEDDGAVHSFATSEEKQASAYALGRPVAELDGLLAQLPDGPQKRGVQAERTKMASLSLPDAMERGAPGSVPPLDLDDPASIARYKQAMRGGAARLGKDVVYLKPEAAAGLRARALSGDAGRTEAAMSAAKWGDAAGAVARQVLPNDPSFAGLAALATLPHHIGAAAVASIVGGKAAVQRYPALLDENARRDLTEEFDKYTGGAFRSSNAMAVAVRDNALLAYAHDMAADGLGGATSADRERFHHAIDKVMGGAQFRDGYAGGIGTLNGVKIVRPVGWTQDRTEKAWFRATPGDYRRAAGGALPDDPRFGTAQIKAMHPEPVGDGRYILRDRDGNVLKKRGGGAYTIDMRLLEGR